MSTLKALVQNCTLKSSPAPSSSEHLAREVLAALADHDVDGEVVRSVDHDVRFGVTTDEGDGDEWPAIHRRRPRPDTTGVATKTLAANAAHLARLLPEALYLPS
jgi:hypothetical protein